MHRLRSQVRGLYVEDPSDLPSNVDRPYAIERTVPRYSFFAIVELTESENTMCIVASVNEISHKGCYVYTPSTLGVGTILKLVISRDQDTFISNGKVLYVRDRIGMGIAFIDTPEEQLEILDAWLAGLSSKFGL
jgi:hypothetical protein